MGILSFIVQSGSLLSNCATDFSTRCSFQYAAPPQAVSSPIIEISSKWDILGPFQIGTREAAWGADPLEYHGGFSSLQPNPNATFPSSLSKDGRARWSHIVVSKVNNANASSKTNLVVSFQDNVDWPFLQQVYGWAATQWQAWARTELIINSEKIENVIISTPQVFEFKVDGQRYVGGDFFAYNSAPPVIQLTPGKHVFELRLVRDVRSMGGIGKPTMELNLEARIPAAAMEIGDVLVSDVIDGTLASPFAKVSLRNIGTGWLTATVTSNDSSSLELEVMTDSLLKRTLRIAPGQTLPVPLQLTLKDPKAGSAAIKVTYHSEGQSVLTTFPIPFRRADTYAPHKVTHLHPSGIVSYAVLRPPSENATCTPGQSLAPVALFLHGAGVEADSDIAKKTFDPIPNLCAWALMPTGVTTWSSDDWHSWGFLDVVNAVYYTQLWIANNNWKGIGVDITKTLVIGHSNGGQGTWFALSRLSSFIIGAAPLSGYLSIPLYVPTTWWRPADPIKKAAIDFAMAPFKNDLLVSNFAHIPIYQQHGELDDNVPAYHSALMYQLVNETGSFSEYDVPKGKPHWWENVATEPGLLKFYDRILSKPQVTPLSEVDGFVITLADPAETSGRFGIRVNYLQEQGRLGKLKAMRMQQKDVWRFVPDNIMVFEIDTDSEIGSVVIDDPKSDAAITFIKSQPGRRAFTRIAEGKWVMNDGSIMLPSRSEFHFGGLNAILRSSGPFLINATSAEVVPLAIQASRNLHTYFAAEASIFRPIDKDGDSWPQSHMITIATGSNLPTHPNFSIRVASNRIQLRTGTYSWRYAIPSEEPHSAIFLRPSEKRGLELVIWGANLAMTEQAARLLPMVSGTGQPDWIICRKEMMWKGVDGCEMGWFDAWWKIQA